MGREVFESRGLGGRDALVEDIKTKAGELHDLLLQVDAFTTDGTSAVQTVNQRPAALARTNLEIAVMCAVKAISRGQ
jgi:hypothetical protein